MQRCFSVMMVSKKETAKIRSFVCEQLSDAPDLNTLTLGILKKQYLAHVKCESLSPEAKRFMKQVVEEELVKMQENDKNGDEVETKKPQNKRKRGSENEEVERECKIESRAKKSRSYHSSSSESEDAEDCKTGSEDEERIKSPSHDMKQEVKKSELKRPGNRKPLVTSDDSTDDEIDEPEKRESESEDSPKKMVKEKAPTAKKGKTGGSDTSGGKQMQESDKDSESDADSESSKSEKINESPSSESEKEEKVLSEKKNNDSDSDSSSLSSLEEKRESQTKKEPKDKKKQKTARKDKSTRGEKEDDKAVARLRRYISLCGVWRNYKKLLDGCQSVGSKVAVLKKELKDLGVHGNPSIQKCKKIRQKREEAQEVAALDVSNIITTQGRPKRRGPYARKEQHDPPSSAYQRTLNSGSDSDQENNSHKGRRKISEWANLRGIISDDADSD